MCFGRKSKNTTTTKQKMKHKTLAGAGNETQDLSTSQLRVTIVVKLFNLLDAIGRTVNKQSRICGPHIFNKFVFSVIFLHAWITILGSFSYIVFTGVGFTA